MIIGVMQGQDFLVAKTFDITLLDFKQIDEILKRMDTKGIHTHAHR